MGVNSQSRGNFESTQLAIRRINPMRLLREITSKDRLTFYEAYTIRKIIPRDPKEKPTWAEVEVCKESLSQENITDEVKKLNESKRRLWDKKAALMALQAGQVIKLLDKLMTGETDTNFEWTVAQIDRKEITNKRGKRETLGFIVYVTRAPLKYPTEF
jgi:hypothetical protein